MKYSTRQNLRLLNPTSSEVFGDKFSLLAFLDFVSAIDGCEVDLPELLELGVIAA